MIITTVSKTFNHRDIVVQKLGLNQKIYLCVCRTSIAQCYSDWLLKGSLPMRSQLFCERRSFDKVWVLNFSCISCQKQTIVKWTHPTPCWHLWIVRVENENKPSKGTYFLQMSPTSPFHTSHIEPSPNSPVMWFHFSFELTMPVSNWSKPGVGFFLHRMQEEPFAATWLSGRRLRLAPASRFSLIDQLWNWRRGVVYFILVLATFLEFSGMLGSAGFGSSWLASKLSLQLR